MGHNLCLFVLLQQKHLLVHLKVSPAVLLVFERQFEAFDEQDRDLLDLLVDGFQPLKGALCVLLRGFLVF